MTRETKFRGGMIMSLLGMVVMTFLYFQQQEKLKRSKEVFDFIEGGDIEKQMLINERDSLRSELFVTGVQLTRYEITFEMFKEKNKSGAEEFELIFTTQTE